MTMADDREAILALLEEGPKSLRELARYLSWSRCKAVLPDLLDTGAIRECDQRRGYPERMWMLPGETPVPVRPASPRASVESVVVPETPPVVLPALDTIRIGGDDFEVVWNGNSGSLPGMADRPGMFSTLSSNTGHKVHR